jgi:hypothetical protein
MNLFCGLDIQRGTWIAFVKWSLPMAADDSGLEAEREYWKTRLGNLEMLLCELLAKNERLRQESHLSTSVQSDQRTAQTDF